MREKKRWSNVIALACAGVGAFSWCAFALAIEMQPAQTSSHSAPQSTAGLQIDTIAEQRAPRDGPQQNGTDAAELMPATRLKIGDEIFYTLRVRNTLSAPIAEAIVIRAVPRNTVYVADSAVGPATQVSLSFDGGRSFVAAVEARDAANTVTHIHWRLKHPLAPGATALLRFRGVFN